MSVGRAGLLAAAALVGAGACAPGALDPVGTPPPGTLGALAGPNARLIVGRNGGAVVDAGAGSVAVFEQEPGALVEAAAAVAMPVCSVELQRLATATQGAGPDAVTVEDAMIACDGFDLGIVREQLATTRQPSSMVLIGANAGIHLGGADRGYAAYHDEDVTRLLRAARALYVPACVVTPESVDIQPIPGDLARGLTIEEALARCGRALPRP